MPDGTRDTLDQPMIARSPPVSPLALDVVGVGSCDDAAPLQGNDTRSSSSSSSANPIRISTSDAFQAIAEGLHGAAGVVPTAPKSQHRDGDKLAVNDNALEELHDRTVAVIDECETEESRCQELQARLLALQTHSAELNKLVADPYSPCAARSRRPFAMGDANSRGGSPVSNKVYVGRDAADHDAESCAGVGAEVAVDATIRAGVVAAESGAGVSDTILDEVGDRPVVTVACDSDSRTAGTLSLRRAERDTHNQGPYAEQQLEPRYRQPDAMSGVGGAQVCAPLHAVETEAVLDVAAGKGATASEDDHVSQVISRTDEAARFMQKVLARRSSDAGLRSRVNPRSFCSPGAPPTDAPGPPSLLAYNLRRRLEAEDDCTLVAGCSPAVATTRPGANEENLKRQRATLAAAAALREQAQERAKERASGRTPQQLPRAHAAGPAMPGASQMVQIQDSASVGDDVSRLLRETEARWNDLKALCSQ